VLRAAKPDLVVLAFGSNEITDGSMYPMDKFRETLAAVMEQIEKAVPDASLMLAGPPDMASNNASQGHSRPMVHFIVENEKKLAGERGWAFWDQYRAMGGGGSMWSWIKAGLGSQDMFHPTGQGGTVLGNWEYLALMEAFDKYKAAQGGR
jgi:lysophospholipase L1-like esterase